MSNDINFLVHNIGLIYFPLFKDSKINKYNNNLFNDYILYIIIYLLQNVCQLLFNSQTIHLLKNKTFSTGGCVDKATLVLFLKF